MSKKRCSYCGKVITNYKTYCNIECKNNYDKFEEYASKRTGLFTVTIFISLIIAFIGMILTVYNKQLGRLVSNIGTLSIFTTMTVFPLATPETVKLLGIKRSLLIVRILGLIMLFENLVSIIMSNRVYK